MNGVCTSCGDGCNRCVGQDCTGCNDKFTLNTTMHSCMRCDDTCIECDYTGGCTKCPSGYSKAVANSKNVCVLIESTSAGTVALIVLVCVIYIPIIVCCVCFYFCCRTASTNLAGSHTYQNTGANPFLALNEMNEQKENEDQNSENSSSEGMGNDDEEVFYENRNRNGLKGAETGKRNIKVPHIVGHKSQHSDSQEFANKSLFRPTGRLITDKSEREVNFSDHLMVDSLNVPSSFYGYNGGNNHRTNQARKNQMKESEYNY